MKICKSTVSFKTFLFLVKKHYKNFCKDLNDFSLINKVSCELPKITNIIDPSTKFKIDFVRNMAMKNFESVSNDTEFKVPNLDILYQTQKNSN
jgi:hypothetical protein